MFSLARLKIANELLLRVVGTIELNILLTQNFATSTASSVSILPDDKSAMSTKVNNSNNLN